MSIYIDSKKRVKDIFINVNGEKKKIASAWADKNGNPTKVFQSKPEVNIVTWANGTDEQIAAMLDAHYKGYIDIHDYWNIGDERTVHLSEIRVSPTESVGENHDEQDITMVLMNSGGKYFVTPINGITKCAFIVGQKDCLKESGVISNYSSTTTGWGSVGSSRSSFLNYHYRNALPEKFRNIFKECKNYSMRNYDHSTIDVVKEFFSLPSATNIVYDEQLGIEPQLGSSEIQFSYYKEQSKRIKKLGESGNAVNWWTRTVGRSVSSKNKWIYVNTSGNEAAGTSNTKMGIAPFGCI